MASLQPLVAIAAETDASGRTESLMGTRIPGSTCWSLSLQRGFCYFYDMNLEERPQLTGAPSAEEPRDDRRRVNLLPYTKEIKEFRRQLLKREGNIPSPFHKFGETPRTFRRDRGDIERCGAFHNKCVIGACARFER